MQVGKSGFLLHPLHFRADRGCVATATQPGGVRQVLANRQPWLSTGELWNVTKFVRIQVDLVQVAATPANGAGGMREDSRDGFQQGALATSRRTDNRAKMAAGEVESDPGEQGRLRGGHREFDRLERQHSSRESPLPRKGNAEKTPKHHGPDP